MTWVVVLAVAAVAVAAILVQRWRSERVLAAFDRRRTPSAGLPAVPIPEQPTSDEVDDLIDAVLIEPEPVESTPVPEPLELDVFEEDVAADPPQATGDVDFFAGIIDRVLSEPPIEPTPLEARESTGNGGTLDVRLPRQLSARRELGRGSYGMWYEAVDGYGREVTVQRWDAEWASSPEDFVRLKAVVKRASFLDHANIAKVKWVEKKYGRVFLLGQHVKGESLADRLARPDHEMALLDIFDLAETVLSTLAFAHRRGVLHRDLRARNVVFTASETIVLKNFGIERELHRKVESFGEHISPEERDGSGVDQRADVYSLARLIRRCLRAQRAIDPPKDLEGLLDRALSEFKSIRPNSADDMLQELRTIRRTIIEPHASESPLDNLESLAAAVNNSNSGLRRKALESAIEEDIGRFIELTRDFLLQSDVDLDTRATLFRTLASLQPVQAMPALGAVVYHFNTRLAGLANADVPRSLVTEAKTLDAVLAELGGERVARLRQVLVSAFGHLLSDPLLDESFTDEGAFAAELAETQENAGDEPNEEWLGEFEPAPEELPEPSAVDSVAPEQPPVDELGRYELVQQLRTDPVADLYLASHNEWGHSVTVRVFKVEGVDESAFARFQLAAQVVSELEHPSINPLLEIGAFSGRPFASEEFIDGHTLAEEIVLHGEGLPLAQVLAVARALADALGHVHEKGLLHRDVSPENVLLIAGTTWRLAHFAFPELTSQPTAATSFCNSSYAAPEVIAGETVDAKADVFALGATLYAALCGHRPFAGEARDTPVIPVRKHRESVPQAIAAAVHRCLALDSDRRPTVRELAEQISAVDEVFDRSWSRETPAASISVLSTPFSSSGWGRDPSGPGRESKPSLRFVPSNDNDPTREFVEATREYQEATREYQDALLDALKDEMDEEGLVRFVKALERI